VGKKSSAVWGNCGETAANGLCMYINYHFRRFQ
jgi:hypothetical protein